MHWLLLLHKEENSFSFDLSVSFRNVLVKLLEKFNITRIYFADQNPYWYLIHPSLLPYPCGSSIEPRACFTQKISPPVSSNLKIPSKTLTRWLPAKQDLSIHSAGIPIYRYFNFLLEFKFWDQVRFGAPLDCVKWTLKCLVV